ncbi:MAG TPA: bifunctional nuclease family protein [Candidatus Omnitrophota bacterium]|nr:bifunctional nuclease family protein [Candidatus Omnitrophota bacterium]HPS36469.1 bifunctional nuclease family protein [Candidatus Omnitrophota bacterium]
MNKIKVDENRHEQLVVFREKDGNRFLPVVIGLPEIHAIKMKLSGVKPPRPMTHDLMLNLVEGLGGKLEKVLIDKLDNNTFHAKLYIRKSDGKEIVVDARPSDSVAMALRAQIPVFADREVLNAASVFEV